LTDAELIRRAREQSPLPHGPAAERWCEQRTEAWNTLSKRYLPVVWRYAYTLLQDPHLTEDVVSEVMLALLKGIDRMDSQAPKISAWLRAVVRHKVADHHRRVYRAKDHLPLVAQEQQSKSGEQQHRGSTADPSAPLLVAEKKQQVAEILEGLPERQQLSLEWKYVEGLSVREIAKRLGETEKAVEATLYRARREFRRLYELSETEAVGIAKENFPHSASEIPWPAVQLDFPKK